MKSYTQKECEEHNASPRYRANMDGQVIKRGDAIYDENTGAAAYTMSFPMCEVPEYVEPRFATAEYIAKVLNNADEGK